MPTPAELERGNLLPKPATVLSAAAGVVYFLIFEEGIGPDATDAQITAWVEKGRTGTVLGIARNGDAVGVAFKVAGGGRTVQNTFLPLDDAPAFGRANLALRYVLQGTDPRKLPDYVGAGAQTAEIDDGVVAVARRAGTAIAAASPGILSAAKWLAVLVLVGLLLYALAKLAPAINKVARA